MSEEAVLATFVKPLDDEDVEDWVELFTDLSLTLAAVDGVTLPDLQLRRFAEEGRRSHETVASTMTLVLSSAAVLRPAFKTVQTWLVERSKRSVKVTVGGNTLEITGEPSSQSEQALQAFLRGATNDASAHSHRSAKKDEQSLRKPR
jgi:hypothetical protein